MTVKTTEPTVVFLHGGSHFQLATMRDAAFTAFRLQPVYIRREDEVREALAVADGVIVADRLHPDLLTVVAPHILDVRKRGGTVAVLGENNVGDWLPGYREESRPTIFWWWRTGEDSLLRPRHPESAAWDIFSTRSVVWHYHGVLHGPGTALSLVDKLNPGVDGAPADDNDVDGSIILVDESGPGRLLVTTMDPVYHNGSGFMPGATQLLYAVMRWVWKGVDEVSTRPSHPVD